MHLTKKWISTNLLTIKQKKSDNSRIPINKSKSNINTQTYSVTMAMMKKKLKKKKKMMEMPGINIHIQNKTLEVITNRTSLNLLITILTKHLPQVLKHHLIFLISQVLIQEMDIKRLLYRQTFFLGYQILTFKKLQSKIRPNPVAILQIQPNLKKWNKRIQK